MDVFMASLSDPKVLVSVQMQHVCHACHLVAGGHCKRNMASTGYGPPARDTQWQRAKLTMK